MKSYTIALIVFLGTQYSSICSAMPSSYSYVEKRDALVKPARVRMGSASKFGGLGATTMTSTGQTVITGNGGIYPGTSITGFPPGIITGTETTGSSTSGDSQQAQADCLVAYNYAKGLTPTHALAAVDLTGLILSPGVYSFPGVTASLTGSVTLDAGGVISSQWVFQIGTTLTTAAASSVKLINGAKACNVYFIVGSSATFGANTVMMGNVLAHTSISVGAAASNSGTFCAMNGAVTLIDNALTVSTKCAI